MQSTNFSFTFFKRVMLLSASLIIFLASCKKSSTPPPPADKTALQAKVAEAQLLYDGTIEGTKPGQYEVGSKTNFLTVLNAAKSVLADGSATQTSVTNAVAQLSAAM